MSYQCLKCESASKRFQPEDAYALLAAYSVIVKTDCETDGSYFYPELVARIRKLVMMWSVTAWQRDSRSGGGWCWPRDAAALRAAVPVTAEYVDTIHTI